MNSRQAETLLKMYLVVLRGEGEGKMKHVTDGHGHPCLFKTRYAANVAIKEMKSDGMRWEAMKVKAFLEDGFTF